MNKKSVVTISDLYPVENEIHISTAVSFLNVPVFNYSTLKKKLPAPGFLDLKLPKGIIDVEVDSHAYERWPQRVGPIVTEDALKNIFRLAVLIQTNRVRVLDRDLAILDDEYVFAFKFEDSIFTITTFFGRISLKPFLSNVDTLRKYNSHFNEEINLVVEKDTLNQQSLPFAPTSVIEFDDSKNTHILFYINTVDDSNSKRSLFFHLFRSSNGDAENELAPESSEYNYVDETEGNVESNEYNSVDNDAVDMVNGEWTIKLIDMQHTTRFILSEIQLHILGLLGNNKFILKYMSRYDPDRLLKLHDTHSRTAIRRFAGYKGWNFLKKGK